MPGGEDRAVSGEDHHAHVVVGLGAQERVGEFDEEPTVLGIAVLDAVENDAGDGALVVGLVLQVLVFGGCPGIGGHGESFLGQAQTACGDVETSARAWSSRDWDTLWKRFPSSASTLPAHARAWVPSRMMARR